MYILYIIYLIYNNVSTIYVFTTNLLIDLLILYQLTW